MKERLDRAFGTASWWNKFPLCNLSVHHASVSDHDPIQVDLFYTSISKKLFRFKFENMWLKDTGFIKEVTDHWLNTPAIHLFPKLLNVSSFRAKWRRVFFNKFREKLKLQKQVIADLIDRTDEVGVDLYLDAKEKLNVLLFQQEIYWKQRAKVFWLEEGDANTKFFHASATERN